MTFFLIVYIISFIICITYGKLRKDSFTARMGFIPFLNAIVAVCILEGLFTEWIEK